MFSDPWVSTSLKAPRYTILAREFREFILRALTDDLPVMIPRQETKEEWFSSYKRYIKFLLR